MVQLEEAIRILKKAVSPVRGKMVVPLLEASGCVLAQDIAAVMDQPPFPRSPLDGYAVRGEDTMDASKERPVVLEVVGKIYAGEVFDGEISAGQCVRLMTGAPIPAGANAVIRQEDTDYAKKSAVAECEKPEKEQEKPDGEGGKSLVKIYRGCAPYQNYCYAGEDYRKGDVLLREGDVLNGARIGLIAGTGRDKVEVYRKPKVTVISTGDEVLAPGEEIKPGKIYDSNRYLVVARLKDLGLSGDRIRSFHCKDEVAAMCESIRDAAACSDLIITTGGVSVGEKDIMHQVLQDLGGEKLFWKVALKPGAPTLAFLVERESRAAGAEKEVLTQKESSKILVICLTGNPYGVAVNFELLVRPVLEKLTGHPGWACPSAVCTLENDSPKRGGRRRFMRGYVTGNTVRILEGSHASGTLSTMASCNCLVEIPEGGSGKAGEKVMVWLL